MFRQNYVGGGSPLFGGLGVAAGPPSSNFQGKRKDTAFTPRVSISFKPDADNSFYASYAQGFKSGGFDLRGVSAAAKDTNNDGVRSHDEIYNNFAFKPEKVTTEEVGYKASLFDRRVYTALAIFNSITRMYRSRHRSESSSTASRPSPGRPPMPQRRVSAASSGKETLGSLATLRAHGSTLAGRSATSTPSTGSS